MKRILIADIGTSSVKAVVFGPDSDILAQADVAYPTFTRPGGRQEQAPEDWIKALAAAVRELGSECRQIDLIGLSGSMQNVIPTDAQSKSVGPAILYSDSRASKEFNDLDDSFQLAGGEQLLGNTPNALMAVFKFEWLRRHRPEIVEQMATFHSGSKDFVCQWLTGARVTDPTAATTVGLMNIRTRQWDADLLELVGLDESRMPSIESADSIIGQLLEEPARTLGLSPDIPVVNGCGDAGASTVGAGITLPGESYVYVGTSAWAAQISNDLNAVTDRSAVYTLAHPTQSDHYIRIGAMLSGGDSAAWFSEAASRSLAELDQLVAEPSFQPSAVMFLPYLKGERCPFLDPNVRGAFLFIDRTDGAAELHFAALEGICFAIDSNLRFLGPLKGDLRLLGGGALSRHLPQLLSDITGCVVEVADRPATATSLGVFKIAADGASEGDFGRSPLADRFQPDPKRRHRMQARRKLFAKATSLVRELDYRGEEN